MISGPMPSPAATVIGVDFAFVSGICTSGRASIIPESVGLGSDPEGVRSLARRYNPHGSLK